MYPNLKDYEPPGKRHEAQRLQVARQTSHCPNSGCRHTRNSRTANCQVNVTQGLQAARQTSYSPSSGCKRTRCSKTASCQANVTFSKLWLQAYQKLKDCKLPGKRHKLPALVVSVPEAQGLQAARQTSRSSRTASCHANVTSSKLWL